MNPMRSRIVHTSTWLGMFALALAAGSVAQSSPAPEARPPRLPRTPQAALAPLAPPAPPAPPAAPGALPGVRAPRLSGGYLGVELVDLTPELREHFGAPRELGVMVGRVAAGSPAARAGLEVGDIVVRVGDEPVQDSWGFSGEVSTREAGDAIALAVVRDRRERRVDATLERRERNAVDIGRWIFPPTPPIPPVAAAPGAPPAAPLPQVGPALERLGRLLESDDFQDQIRAYQLRVDAEVEKRMRELEVRLKELERRLQEGDRRR